MFQVESMARLIHADRVRDLERAARDHRLLAAAEEAAEEAADAGRRPPCPELAPTRGTPAGLAPRPGR